MRAPGFIEVRGPLSKNPLAYLLEPPMLDANLKSQLQSYFERIQMPLELVASLDDSAKSQEM